ncbi:MAG TPA: class I SAM-dependent methyltransferase, partial [Vicinamibacterales bacterium]|nr:class I SAM-dependent methyltransferase [Vicinamibacterales bacterium]
VVLNVMLNSPMPLPTERFLRAGAGRVLDVGAGSGRAAVGVLIARPHVTATGVDIYSGYWGIDGNTPERFMANARIAGVADRAAARVGDMRQLPFGDGEFDAVVSSYAIDHLPRAERPKAIAEVARVLTPGGEFLLMIIRVDWRTWLVSPLLAHHPSQNPELWRELLQQHGFSVEEEGTPFTTLYFLARKHGARRTSRVDDTPSESHPCRAIESHRPCPRTARDVDLERGAMADRSSATSERAPSRECARTPRPLMPSST